MLEGFIFGCVLWAGPALLAWAWQLLRRAQVH